MKKLALFAAALVLAFGLAQCKKDQSSQAEGKTVQITVKVANSGSKANVDPSNGHITFNDGDKLYVGYNNAKVGGELTYSTATSSFSGDLTIVQAGDDKPLYFYYLGGAAATMVDATHYSADISNQSSNYPVISYGTSTTDYTGSGSYETTLLNKCALVKFTLTNGTSDPVNVIGLNTKATIDFTNPGVITAGTPGAITLHAGASDTERWAILLPQAAATADVAVGYSGYTASVPAIAINDFNTTGIAINNSAASNIVHLDYVTANYTATNGQTLTGTLGENVKISIANNATVTLDGITINGVNNSSYRWAGLNCEGNATIILKDGTTNAVSGFYESYPGIHVPNGKTLTIQGTGTLNANGRYGAGIGGGYLVNCGNIEIQSGTINASCSENAAAIGGGRDASCGNITISGGHITAASGWGAGIGSGYAYSETTSCGNISITGGTIIATGGPYCAGIGSGCNSNCGAITITSGVTSVTATKGSDAYNSIGKGWGSGSVTCGTVTIGGVVYWNGSSYQNGGDTYLPTSPLVYPTPAPSVTDLATITENYTASDGEILTGILGANVKISIADGATVTLDGVSINASGTWTTGNYAGITCLGNATIILSGTNTVKGFNVDYPGIHVPAGNTLTIKDSGSLTASSNGHGAGIGGGWDIACGNIEIQGGTVMATGGNLAAGIGSGTNGSCGTITISGGTVRATGGEFGAGIGSGTSGSCGTITISGGNVTAIAGTYGYNTAAIGKSSEGTCTSVTFTPGITSLTLTNSEVFEPIGSYFINATEVYANTTPITGMLSSLPVGAITMAGFATSYDEGTKTWTITKQ